MQQQEQEHQQHDATIAPLLNMEALWQTHEDSGTYPDPPSDVFSSELPPAEWIEEMIEVLRLLVEYGDENNAYECSDHAWNHDEMIEFIESAPGTHPTWKAFQTWALDVLRSY